MPKIFNKITIKKIKKLLAKKKSLDLKIIIKTNKQTKRKNKEKKNRNINFQIITNTD